MKSGRTINEVLGMVNEQESQKRDWVVDTRALAMLPRQDHASGLPGVDLRLEGQPDLLSPTSHFHSQVGERMRIPRQYYNRMLAEAPDLLATNVNHWFRERPQKRMVRSLYSNARAFLSDRYRPFDNLAVARAVLPILGELGNEVRFTSCEITDRRMYLKVVMPRIQAEIKRGDVVQSGLMVSNSEIGLGSTEVLPFLYRCICDNGAIVEEYGKSRRHVGRILGRGGDGEDEGEAFDLFRDETLRLDERAYTEKLRDVVRATVDEQKFQRIVDVSRQATEDRSELKPLELIREVTTKVPGLQESDADPLLQYLCEGGDFTRWGVANAITRFSQDVEDYDRATDLERAGGRLLASDEGRKLWSDLN